MSEERNGAHGFGEGFDLGVGEIITIPKDQWGNPVLKFDRATKSYSATELQRFRVTAIRPRVVDLEPVFDD